MTDKSVDHELNWRSLVAAGLVITVLLLAGCVGRGYSTSVGEPSTGNVIENVTVDRINAMDGATFTMTYSVDKRTDNVSYYRYSTYRFQNGSFEFLTWYTLDLDRTQTPVPFRLPGEEGSAERYQIRIERGENRTVVDSINLTIRRTD